MRLKLSHRALLLVAVPLLFEIGFVVVLTQLLHQAEAELQKQSHAREVITGLNRLLRLLLDSAGGMTAYGYSSEPLYYQRFRNASDRVPVEFAKLEDLVKNDPKELASILRIKELADKGMSASRETAAMLKSGDIAGAREHFGKAKQLSRDLFGQLDQAVAEEMAIEDSMPELQAASRRQISTVLLAGLVFNVVLAILLAVLFNRSTTRRLNVLMDNTVRLAKSEPLCPPIGGEDEIAQLDKVFREMAQALEEAVHKERAIIEHAADVMFSITHNGTLVKVSPASTRVWGFAPQELEGKNIIDVLEPEVGKDAVRLLKEIKSGAASPTFENRIKRKDGQYADMLWSVHWSQSESSWFCVAHDITERKQAEAMIKEAVRLKQEFLAMVSHDLRTPLTSVDGILELIADDYFGEIPDDARTQLGVAMRNTARVMSLVNDLLMMDKMEAGMMQLKFGKVDVNSIVSRSVESCKKVAESKKITIEIPQNHIEVFADGERLTRVVTNLLSNAIKFSIDGSAVSIETQRSDGWFELKVKDTGRGVPHEFQARIFDRFVQVTSTDGAQNKGTGLGLPICKAIIEQHKGTIGVESKEGEGSCFWFRVPVGPSV